MARHWRKSDPRFRGDKIRNPKIYAIVFGDRLSVFFWAVDNWQDGEPAASLDNVDEADLQAGCGACDVQETDLQAGWGACDVQGTKLQTVGITRNISAAALQPNHRARNVHSTELRNVRYTWHIHEAPLQPVQDTRDVHETELRALEMTRDSAEATLQSGHGALGHGDDAELDAGCVAIHYSHNIRLHPFEVAGRSRDTPHIESHHVDILAIENAQPQADDGSFLREDLNRIEQSKLNGLVRRVKRYGGEEKNQQQSSKRQDIFHIISNCLAKV